MTPPVPHSRALHGFAVLTAAATLGLIALGGLVTSHGAGMAVPDWPTTYGYNMFLFPISQWVGGIFYEHTHRLYASVVGLLTVILSFWLHGRGPSRRVARLGWIALALVIVQGVLGGLRVSLMQDQIGVIHAALAQVFLVLLAFIALATSRRWARWSRGEEAGGRTAPARASGGRPGGEGNGESWLKATSSASRWMAVVTGLIFLQLLLGATMRHQHAGLAVPDFPLAYNRVWPVPDEAFLHRVNALRSDTRDFLPVTAWQIHLHMIHRYLGLALAVVVVAASLRLRRIFGPGSDPGRLGTVWMGLIVVQVVLGAATVWSNKAADMATAHVVVGACCLLVGAIGTAYCRVAASQAAGRTASVDLPDSGSPAWAGVKA